MSAEIVRLIRDGEKGGGGGGVTEIGEEGDYIPNATMSAETIRLIRDGEKGREVLRRLGKREIIYLTLQCPQKS